MSMRIEVDIEDDGRFIAEVPAIPGALVYGDTADDAIRKVESLVLRILADRIDSGEDSKELEEVFTVSA
ncbi:MAG: type II toxin-antitoxin system HicB family antitoxin [Verrucomicrobia bacterium]|nr:MAG: type II toxin-antitoxin system HicB family antitoxin [Verrucomicrobiota bacterium]